MDRVKLGTWDMTRHPLSALPCTRAQNLVLWSQSPAMVDCEGDGKKRPCVCAETSAGASNVVVGYGE